ncbi:competence type IV pilus major pilin ComGC [Streptococcus parauberis]|uniref:Prepilin-type cleavage/methylation N-terminal domain protein n=1 Tax=Streptococcus parauberis NCFD 2020 TaxID=873447 RepID=F1Z0F6_9STRE|nr:competence type IV pilus major pilin ComGC [Streptococcus parauberis]EGE54443.1 prepilin-type cleavage/methylation N-terminal domain protein [Streptococcus parauberis NCFD 2020]
MKKFIINFKNKSVQAFTLLEMLMVILIISILMLLFIPNLNKQKEKVLNTGGEALVKIVENQAELYALNNAGKVPSLNDLKSNVNLTEKQITAYNDYYKKHSDKIPNVK